jgi:hypothetical protein
LLFVFAIDDLGGANIYPAIWSALLAARAEGVGGVMTMVLRNFADKVNELLGVPVEEGWTMSAMLALGYPLGKWGVAANRHPVHEVSSRNGWGKPFGVEVPQPLWPDHDDTAKPAWPQWDESPPELPAQVRSEHLAHCRPVPLGGIGVIGTVVRHGVPVRGGIGLDLVLDPGRGQGLLELLGVVGGE